jgi:hypothetical protein
MGMFANGVIRHEGFSISLDLSTCCRTCDRAHECNNLRCADPTGCRVKRNRLGNRPRRGLLRTNGAGAEQTPTQIGSTLQFFQHQGWGGQRNKGHLRFRATANCQNRNRRWVVDGTGGSWLGRSAVAAQAQVIAAKTDCSLWLIFDWLTAEMFLQWLNRARFAADKFKFKVFAQR